MRRWPPICYWTRVVQYYGNKHVTGQTNLDLLWPLLDVTINSRPQPDRCLSLWRNVSERLSAAGSGATAAGYQAAGTWDSRESGTLALLSGSGFIYYCDLRDYPKAAEAFLWKEEEARRR